MAEPKKIDREALAYIISRIATFEAFFAPDEDDEFEEDDPHVNWSFLPFAENMEKARHKCQFEYLSDEELQAVENTPEYYAHIHTTSDDEDDGLEFDEKGRIYGIVCGWSWPGDLDDDDDFGNGYRRLCVRFAYVDRDTPKEKYRDIEAWKNPFFDAEAEEEDEEPGEDFDWRAYLDAPASDIPDTDFGIYSRASVYGYDTFESEWVNYLKIADKIIALYERAVSENGEVKA
ncbi:MAG: hypothetical protein K6G16_11855 [Lachnospiraceae bacterium]|nr:hypothetical protein [Lachnospiraceae bacterium]